jgi:hypothetical protein
MAALGASVHGFFLTALEARMAGSSPAMTARGPRAHFRKSLG